MQKCYLRSPSTTDTIHRPPPPSVSFVLTSVPPPISPYFFPSPYTPLVRGGRSDRVSLLAGTFRNRLNVATLGFAAEGQDFSVLESMAAAAKVAGAGGNFYRPELSSSGLASALASAIASLTHTKSTLSSTLVAAPAGRLGGGGRRRILSPIQEVQKESPDAEDAEGWVLYTDGARRSEYRPESVYEETEEQKWKTQSLFSASADALAIRKLPFEEGAERKVFKMQVRTCQYVV